MTNSVNKGKAFERAIVQRLKAAGINCHRNLSQSRSARQEGCDIEGTPWWLELCHAKAASPQKKWDQAYDDQSGEEPADRDWRPIIVIWKRDGMREVLASMSLDALMDLDRGDISHRNDNGPLVTLDLDDVIEMMRCAEEVRDE